MVANLLFTRVFAFICRCFIRNYVMIFQPLVCDFQSIIMKRFSVSEDDNKTDSQDSLGYVLFNEQLHFYSGAELENKKSQTVGLGLKDYLSHDN